MAMLAVATMAITALFGGAATANVYRGACFTRPGCTGRFIGYNDHSRGCWRDGGRSWISTEDGDCYDRFPR